MRKQILQISSAMLMVGFLAAPAYANDEDAAAPAGSFTSDMAVPHAHGDGFRERMMHFMQHHARHDRSRFSQ